MGFWRGTGSGSRKGSLGSVDESKLQEASCGSSRGSPEECDQGGCGLAGVACSGPCHLERIRRSETGRSSLAGVTLKDVSCEMRVDPNVLVTEDQLELLADRFLGHQQFTRESIRLNFERHCRVCNPPLGTPQGARPFVIRNFTISVFVHCSVTDLMGDRVRPLALVRHRIGG